MGRSCAAEFSPAKIDCHLIAELAVIPGDPGDELQFLPSFHAPLVNDIELLADQAAASVIGVGGDQLRTTDTELDAPIRPDLVDQAKAGNDLTGGGVFNDGEIVSIEGGVLASEQLFHP